MIADVLERANDSIVGRYVEENGIALVVPDDPRINQDVMVPLQDTAGARPGQVVVATTVTEPSERQPPVGRITETLARPVRPAWPPRLPFAAMVSPMNGPKA